MAFPATCDDGSAAVLKIQFPDRESEHEAAALELMDDDGAVRLIAYDAGRRALLLERADPGTPLKELEPDRALLDGALEAIDALGGSQGEQVLVSQDMHADNVVRAEREPWLLIDPKPLAREREFGIAPTVRGRELGHSREAVVHRLDRLTGELHLDRERARGWALAQTIAWAFDGDETDPANVEIARWLWEADR